MEEKTAISSLFNYMQCEHYAGATRIIGRDLVKIPMFSPLYALSMLHALTLMGAEVALTRRSKYGNGNIRPPVGTVVRGIRL